MYILYTRHATSRMAQRGVRPDDVRAALENGTPVNDNMILMRRKDAGDNPALQPAVGIVIVIKDGKVITAYRIARQHEKRCLRRIRG